MTDIERAIIEKAVDKIDVDFLLEKIDMDTLTDKIAEKVAERIIKKELPTGKSGRTPWNGYQPGGIEPIAVMYGVIPDDGFDTIKAVAAIEDSASTKK